jgi:hypothetical protein
MSNILVENNTFAFDEAGWARARRTTAFGGMIYWSAAGVTYVNNVVRNNIFYSCPTTMYAYAGGKTGSGGITMDYNCYYTDGSLSAEHIMTNPNYLLDQFSQYQAATGQDEHSFVADPGWVDLENLDFRLAEGSPCIGSGTTGTSERDINGYPRNSPQDIGAYAYGSTTPVLRRKMTFKAGYTPADFTETGWISGFIGDSRFIMPNGLNGACAVYDLSGNRLKTMNFSNGSIILFQKLKMPDGIYVIR